MKRNLFSSCFLFVCAVAYQFAFFSLRAEADDAKPTAIAEIKRDEPVAFAEVQKILAKNCFACHSGSKAESSLVLETPEMMKKGGDSGPVILPKKSAESLLLKAAAHQEEPFMPPPDNTVNAKKLTPEELGLIKLWIDQGAPGAATSKAPELKWQPLPPTVQPILSVAMTDDGRLAAAGRGNEIHVYEVATNRVVAKLIDPTLSAQAGANRTGIAHLDLVQSLAFHPSGDLLASGGFREVKLWRRPSNVRLGELPGASEPVLAIATSADGKWAATGEANGTIRLSNLSEHKMAHTLAGHAAAITGLRFSLDGARLFSSSKDKTIRAWNVADGAAVGKIDAPVEVNGIALVNSGQEIVSADADNVLRVWALPAEATAAEPPKPVKELKGHGGPVTAVDSQLPDGRVILSGSQDGSLRVWNYDNGQQVRQMDHGGPVAAVAIRMDGKRLASGGANSAVKLWNADDGKMVVELKGDYRNRFAVARLDRNVNLAKSRVNDRKKAIGEAEQLAKKEAEAVPKAMESKTAADKTLTEKTDAHKKVAEGKATAEKELETAKTAAAQATEALTKAKEAAEKDAANQDLAKARDEAQKAASEADEKVKQAQKKVEDAAKPLEQAQRELKTAQSAAESANRNLEATQKASAKAAEAIPVAKQAAEAAEAAQKQVAATLEEGKKNAAAAEKPVRTVAFSPDNLQLAIGGDNGLVQLYSAESGTPVDVFTGQGASLLAAAYTSAGTLITSADNKSVVHWNTQAPWTLAHTIGKAEDPSIFVDRVISLDFSPDGKLLATAGGEPSRSGELKLWNVADPAALALARVFNEPHSDTIFAARFSPEGDQIATSGADRFVKVWKTEEASLVRALEGHTHHVLGVAWRMDGKILASGSADNTIKVWDTQTGEQKRTIQGLAKEVTSISFVADTSRAIVSAGDNTVRLYNTDSGGNERNFGGASDFVYSAAASADGKLVVGGGQDGVLRLWNGENAQVVKAFEPPKVN
ncbi:MAG: c-type cytochrome domain-containing protein [Pirellulales bacterium]